MDIQRLILWLVFSFSGVILWQAWEREHNPPLPVPTAQTAAPVPGQAANGVPARAPVPPAATAGPAVHAPGRVRADRRARAGRARRSTIHTDLYTADIDTVGGVDHPRRTRDAPQCRATSPNRIYVLQRNAERTFVAQAGLIGDGLPNHRTPYEVAAGPARAAAGRRPLRPEAAGDRAQRRQGRADADVPSRQLRDRRRVTTSPTPARAPITPVRVLPARCATRSRPACRARWRRRLTSARSSTTTRTSTRRSTSPRSTRTPPIPSRKPPYTQDHRQRLGRDGRALLRRRVAAVRTTPKISARVLHDASSTTASTRRASSLSDGHDRAGRDAATSTSRLYVGPQDQEALAKLAKGLNLVVDYGIFTIIAAPLFLLLKWLHELIGNWGWAIIVMTIMIKSAFYPLNHATSRARWRR